MGQACHQLRRAGQPCRELTGETRGTWPGAGPAGAFPRGKQLARQTADDRAGGDMAVPEMRPAIERRRDADRFE